MIGERGVMKTIREGTVGKAKLPLVQTGEGFGDWRDLCPVRPEPIDPRCFEVVQLSRIKALEVIRLGLPKVRAHPWREDASSLDALFGLETETHCFNEAPHQWIDPLEPQITKGFVYFLTDCSLERQRARCLSFAKAALACSPRSIPIKSEWKPLKVRAEAEENRIDILVELSDGKTHFGVAIEAKFGHRLTPGQLEKAEQHVLDQSGPAWDSSRSAFLVVAPLISRIDAKLLKPRPYWQPVSWWSFLTRLEHEIDGSHDCVEYRRFRRSVWYKAY